MAAGWCWRRPGRVQESQRPDYRTVELERPELYFSPTLSGYAIANSESSERECDEPHQYEGTNGVQMNSFLRRASFALAFLDYNVLGSGAINQDSQMLWVRGVNDRLEKLAPFLSYDTDPYPVALDGRAVWVVDAYTTTTRYPYGQRIGDVQRKLPSGLSDNDNYVRNSVKAVVDAYSGEVTFYVVDEQDPILAAWRSAFPNLFTSLEQMPAELREHLRYPEDLFRIQTDVYSKYRIDPTFFFQRDGNAWSVAQAPSPSPTSSNGGVGGGSDRRDGDGRRADVRLGVRLVAVLAVLHGVRHEPAGRADEQRVRPLPPVRAVLDERHPHPAAGVHDRVERSGLVRSAHHVHRRGRAMATTFRMGRCGWRATPSRPRRSRDASRSTTSATAVRRFASATSR